jgi:hypothetical protein
LSLSAAERQRRYRERHPERVRAALAEYRDRNRDKRRASSLQWAREHRELMRQQARQWHADNRQRALARSKRYTDEGRYLEQKRKYRDENRELLRAQRRAAYRADPAAGAEKVTRRKRAERKATPRWADMFLLLEAYRLAHLRTKATGFRWHVDHIIPLRAKTVCGLHVHTNLRVVPWLTNLAKGNRVWPDM